MSGAGGLRLEASIAGDRVTRVTVANARPLAARVLVGRPVVEALRAVPALFAVCGRAQGLAAVAACAAAGAQDVERVDALAEERSVTAEMAQEHLWRLMLDWPALFGHGSRRERFANLYRRLDQIGGRDARAAFELGGDLLDLVAVEILAGFFQSIREPHGLGEFVERARSGGDIGAALADLIEMGSSTAESESVPLLPLRSASEWAGTLERVPEPAFCAAPSFEGVAHETGALARHKDSLLVRTLLARGHRVAARLFARAIDLADCGSRLRHPLAADLPRLVDGAPLGDGVGAGLACVETARGLLMHAVRIEKERIAQYAIVAPTEWNFHPAGAFVREGAGWTFPSREAALQRLKALALSLDPCVPYEIVLREEGEGDA